MYLSNNERKVLQAIFSSDIVTRNDIAKYSDLSGVAVTKFLWSLENKGYISKTGKTHKQRGRPSYTYQLNSTFGYAIGVSLSLSSFRMVVIDAAKNILYENSHPLDLLDRTKSPVDEILTLISCELKNLSKGNVIETKSISSIGIALPGMTDTEKGLWLHGLRVYGVSHINVSRIFEEKLGIPIVVEDPSRALTFFEKIKGSGKAVKNFILVHLGDGVGSGIVIDNRLYRGAWGLAGEIGHMIVDKNGSRCTCGSIGCLQTVISNSGILRRFKQGLREGVISSLEDHYAHDLDFLTFEHILTAAKENDRFAQSTLLEVGSFLGQACGELVRLFNPQKIIISGDGSIFKDYFREAINLVIEQSIFPEMLSGLDIEFADYSPNHEAIGVALFALIAKIDRS